MQRKYVTKKLVARISDLTNGLFKQSVIEVMNCPNPTVEEINNFLVQIRRAGWIDHPYNGTIEEIKDLLEKKEKIDDLYLNKMMMLNTDDLNDILLLHEHKKPERALRTLEAIYSELARRAILNDSSQSDAIYSNGEVNVKQKSKSFSKTTSKKRNKADKNR